jgi:hypothetical protein
MVFVEPTSYMKINYEGCDYVDSTGLVSTPYLARWNAYVSGYF